MVLAELTIFPTDKGISVSPYVARVIAIIRESGLDHQLTAMSTIIEGGWDEVMALVTRCFRALEPDCERINVALKIDYRRGDMPRMKRKVERIGEILGG